MVDSNIPKTDAVKKEDIKIKVQKVEPNIEDPKKVSNAMNDKLDKYLEDARKEREINKDFNKDMKTVYNDFKEKGMFDKDGNYNENQALQKGNIRDLKSWSSRNPKLIMEIADNAAKRIYERTNIYEDAGEPYVQKKQLELADLEAAEDDRVLGIPYAQAMAGDRVFIINGKVFTGWALYFSLSSIKSPEDYARNIDLVYNVPYLHASILLKAQLGLGTSFDVNYGTENEEVSEERLIRQYLFKKLRINTQKLVKTGFHLYTYGNAYWALRRDKDGLVDKITILQPERIKIFLDPMTTKILFYIYLPPIIGGTTIASYPSDGAYNPNILTGVTLSYPTPIVMHPEDVCHFKINDFTEYPFGFSDVKYCLDPAAARLDINILAPIIFKKYTKPMIHWALKTEGFGPKQIDDKIDDMITILEDMEPGSDPVTTDRWKAEILTVNQGKNDILALTGDIDTQIFAATGAPESYFKPKGSTDRMISEQDKTFISRLKIPQSIVAEQIEEKLIKPKIDYEIQLRENLQQEMNVTDKMEDFLKATESWMASEPKYPEVVWNEIFKQDETQAIANAIALANAGIIDQARAAVKVGEKPIEQQNAEDVFKVGIDDPLQNLTDPFEIYSTIDKRTPLQKAAASFSNKYPSNDMPEALRRETAISKGHQQMIADPKTKIPLAVDKREIKNTPSSYNEQENMEVMRGGLNVIGKKDESSRNINDVQDPSKLGGSKYKQFKIKPGGGNKK